jgi:hypothetical protein
MTFSPRVSGVSALSSLLLAAMVAASPGASPSGQAADPAAICNISTSERVVAVGDAHGAYDTYVSILREAGLLDQRRRWTGGKSVMVQAGDVLDRGDDSRKILDLIRQLEGDAARAGGRVIFLVGNHEVMRHFGDLRYVSDGEYAAFRDSQSTDLRERLFASVSERAKNDAKAGGKPFDERAYREEFLKDVPLGRVEMQRAFLPSGVYGKWLREHDVMARINGMLFLHGGISPVIAAKGCEALVATTRTELQATDQPASPGDMLVTSPDGPLWYRGLVDGSIGAPEVDGVLKAVGAKTIVVGHTVTETRRITSHHDGKVIAIDTGMLDGTFFPNGQASALEIKDGTMTAIYIGKREPVK